MMAITLINSFADYCNHLLVGFPAYQTNRIHAILNDASRQYSADQGTTMQPIIMHHSALSSKSSSQCTRHSTIWHSITSPATANQIASPIVDSNFGLQTRASSSCLKLLQSSANDHLLLPDFVCGTICKVMFDNLNWLTSLREDLKHFCLINLLGINIM